MLPSPGANAVLAPIENSLAAQKFYMSFSSHSIFDFHRIAWLIFLRT